MLVSHKSSDNLINATDICISFSIFARKVALIMVNGDNLLSQRRFPSRHQISHNFVAVTNDFY